MGFVAFNPESLSASPWVCTYGADGNADAAISGVIDLTASHSATTPGGNGPARWFRVGSVGDVVVQVVNPDSGTPKQKLFKAVQLGELIRCQAVALVATGTTAGNITFFW